MAAHDGTPAGLAGGVGVLIGEGLAGGVGDGEGASGLGDSVATSEGEGLATIAVACPPHPATRRQAATTSSWRLTGP